MSLNDVRTTTHSMDCIMITDHQTVTRSRLALQANESSLADLTAVQEDNKTKCGIDVNKFFNKKLWRRRLPILQWLPNYNKDDFIGDLIAGITGSLAAIPLALAFAFIAGLPTKVPILHIIWLIVESFSNETINGTIIFSLLFTAPLWVTLSTPFSVLAKITYWVPRPLPRY